MAHDISDNHSGPSIAEVEHVEPVPPDLLAVGRSNIAGCDIQTGHGGEGRQQPVLKGFGDVVFATVQSDSRITSADDLLEGRRDQC